MAAAGIVDGVPADEFRPAGTLTRGQLAKVLVLTWEYATGQDAPSDAADAFVDDDGTLFEPFVDQAAALGLVEGTSDTDCEPGRSVTRGELAGLVANPIEAVASAGSGQA